jgi:hypothetical protein
VTIQLVTRNVWRARPATGAYTVMPHGVRGVKVHYTGGHVDPACRTDHGLCYKSMRGIQSGHMDGNGWLDIGYSFVVCPHRAVFVARGLHHLPAANGPGLNGGHYAVLGLVGNSGLTIPSDDMLHGICDAIDYIRREGPAGTEVKGHRDGYSTDCPGKALYAWLRHGAPRPGTDVAAWPGRVLAYPPVVEGNDVFRWQKRMRTLGYTIVIDGAYGPHSKSICSDFQTSRGLVVDGMVGKATWTATFA